MSKVVFARGATMMKKARAQRNTSRRQPYAWLGAGALGVGLALAGAGTAHADDSVNETASAAATASSARASGNAAAGAAAKSTPRSPAATSRSAGPRQSVNDDAGKRASTAANRSTLAATPRVRSAVPVAAPAAPVQAPPTASATAAVPSEAGDRPLRRTVVRAVAAPAPVAAPATARAAVNPAEALNAAVVDWFDSTSAWLATLPRGPLNELASGALMLVRRSLFDQQPTVNPYQFLTRADGQMVGTLGSVDPEGSALSYSLTGAPEFGTVQLSSDGTWTYTPRADVAPGTEDSFTVVVSDGGGFNILKPATSALEVDVPVGVFSQRLTSDPLKGSGAGHWFNVMNYSSSPVVFTQLIGECPKYCTGDDLMYVPPIGTVVGVGDMTHFQIGQWVFLQFDTRAKFTSVPGAYRPEDWKVMIHSAWGSTASGPSNIGCESGDCTADRYTQYTANSIDNDRVFLLDPPGTEVNLGSAEAQKQAEILSKLCGSQPNCAFDPLSYDETAFSDWRDKAAPYSNLTDVQQSYTFKQTSSVKTTSTLKVSESLGITLGKIVKAGIAKERSDSWEEANSFEYTYPVNVPARTLVNFLWRDPVKNVTGDFTTKLGNTTWNLTNVTFGFPDPGRQGEIKVTQTSISNLAD
jgi:hypothetical protein